MTGRSVSTCRQREVAAPLDLICGIEKMRGRERRKNMRGGRKREERGEGGAAADMRGPLERAPLARHPTHRAGERGEGCAGPDWSAAGSSSFTPHWARDASVQPSRL